VSYIVFGALKKKNHTKLRSPICSTEKSLGKYCYFVPIYLKSAIHPSRVIYSQRIANPVLSERRLVFFSVLVWFTGFDLLDFFPVEFLFYLLMYLFCFRLF